MPVWQYGGMANMATWWYGGIIAGCKASQLRVMFTAPAPVALLSLRLRAMLLVRFVAIRVVTVAKACWWEQVACSGYAGGMMGLVRL